MKKLRRILIAFGSLLMLAETFVLAQETPPILDEASRHKGIYRDFQEFLDNAPSIQSPFQIRCESGENKIENGTADYKLLLLDTLTKRREIRKFWGVCDGTNIYVNEAIYGGPLNFKKIHGVGRYCYFKGSLVNNSGTAYSAGASGGAIGGVLAAGAMEIDGDYPYIMNINNGKFYLLDKDLLQTILKKDEELFALYDEEDRKSKKNTLISYIIKYNERHHDEIKYNHQEPINITFYRRQKKERAEPIPVIIGNTVELSLNPNSLQQITWMRDSLEACIGPDCKTIALDRKQVNYIECSWKSDQYELKKVESRVGEFYKKEILHLNESTK